MTIDLQGRDRIPVACECGWDNGERLEMVDRYATDHPPIPHFSIDAFVEVYLDAGGDPDDRVAFCPECDGPLDRRGCVDRSPWSNDEEMGRL